MLIVTQFLHEYQATISLKEGALAMLGYPIPLIFEEAINEKGNKIQVCTIEYHTGFFSLMYWRHRPNL